MMPFEERKKLMIDTVGHLEAIRVMGLQRAHRDLLLLLDQFNHSVSKLEYMKLRNAASEFVSVMEETLGDTTLSATWPEYEALLKALENEI